MMCVRLLLFNKSNIVELYVALAPWLYMQNTHKGPLSQAGGRGRPRRAKAVQRITLQRIAVAIS